MKICKDCKHSDIRALALARPGISPSDRDYICYNPNLAIRNLVTGEVSNPSCYDQRKITYNVNTSSPINTFCGYQGILWEAREE